MAPRSAPPQVLEWFQFSIGRERWRVVLLDLEGAAAGYCHFRSRVIEIDITGTVAQQDSTMCHELTHAMFGETRTMRQYNRHEAEVTTRYEPRMFLAFKSLGFRWPSRPAGYAKLRRAVMRRCKWVE